MSSEQSSNRRENKSVMFFAKTLSFGSMVGPREFASEWTVSQDVQYIIQHTQRRVHIYFSHSGTDYKIEYNFKDVHGDMHFEREKINPLFFLFYFAMNIIKLKKIKFSGSHGIVLASQKSMV
ncbi:hypothetical protein MFLAVUS_005738 [Mucor flavus]|uniref:Uncharacterized protein n=1 Tax=Mucor flavus TaxID=439312 RepID=A0ABP9YZK1_9FUNG